MSEDSVVTASSDALSPAPAARREEKHTAGPWMRGQTGNLRIYGPDGCGSDSGLIATVHRARDVNLIAAAPELYAALKWFIDDIDSTHTVMIDFDANVARARIALACGA